MTVTQCKKHRKPLEFSKTLNTWCCKDCLKQSFEISVKQREYQKKYARTQKRRLVQKRYDATVKGKETRRRYALTSQGKAAKKRYQDQYNLRYYQLHKSKK